MHQPGSRVRPIFWDIVLKVLNAFVLVSPHTCTLGQGQGLGLGMSCARWTRFVHLYRWLRDMQACQKQRGESWAVSVKSAARPPGLAVCAFNRESGNIESPCCTTTFTPSQSNAECFGFRLPSCLVMSSCGWPFAWRWHKLWRQR